MASTGDREILPLELADEIANYLATRGFGVVGTNIFVLTLPDDPDQAILVRIDGGGPGDGLQRPHLRIDVRDTLPEKGAPRAEQLYRLFHKTVLVTPSFVGRTTCDYYPANWSRDPDSRVLYPLPISLVGKLRRTP